jgi:hypothetical protein
MKTLYSKALSRVLIVLSFALATSTAFSQLKIGTNPTVINKSSILELETDQQGFLLPRLTDTLQINSLTPPDGMLIYLASPAGSGRGLYIRKSGIWQRFTTDSVSLQNWSKNGDVLLGTEKLGSLNTQALKIITNNINRIIVDGNTGDVAIANNTSVGKTLTVTDTTITRRLQVADSIQFKALNSTTSLTEILVIDTANGGSIRRRTIATDAFKNWFIGAFKNTDNPNGLERIVGPVSDSLVLHAASANTPGGVSNTTQTFSGHKTFQDSLTAAQTLLIGATGSANSTLQVQGSVSFPIKTVAASYPITKDDYTILADATTASFTVTLPAPSTSITGRTYIIKKIGGGLNNDITVASTGNTIEDGVASFKIYNDWTVTKVQTDGTKWYIIK